MIKITCINGPFAGRVRNFQGRISVETGERVDLFAFFSSFVRKGWRWEVDYSEATAKETAVWFREDLAASVIRTLKSGLTVYFLGREYKITQVKKLSKVAKELEDHITSSGMIIGIDSDDGEGLFIGVRGKEESAEATKELRKLELEFAELKADFEASNDLNCKNSLNNAIQAILERNTHGGADRLPKNLSVKEEKGIQSPTAHVEQKKEII